MRAYRKRKIARWVWAGFFGLWLLFLSGVLDSQTGAPGLIQAYRLRQMLLSNKQDLIRGETQIVRLQSDIECYQNAEAVQEAEIRRELGYIAKDEIVLEFASPAQKPKSEDSKE